MFSAREKESASSWACCLNIKITNPDIRLFTRGGINIFKESTVGYQKSVVGPFF